MCWLLPGSFDCFCCPHTSVHRPSIAWLAVFLCGPGALFLHALSGPSTICPFPPHGWSAPDGLPLLLCKQPIWAAPPQKAPTETDSRAPEVTRNQNSANNESGIFGISGSESHHLRCIWRLKEIDHFQFSKKFSAPEFIITDERSCQLSPFPQAPPPPVLGDSIEPPPPQS